MAYVDGSLFSGGGADPDLMSGATACMRSFHAAPSTF